MSCLLVQLHVDRKNVVRTKHDECVLLVTTSVSRGKADLAVPR